MQQGSGLAPRQPAHPLNGADNVEVRQPGLPQRIREPSRAEAEDHEATGCTVYRSWCKICIAAKWQASPHHDADGESELPEIGFDCGYMGDGQGDEACR